MGVSAGLMKILERVTTLVYGDIVLTGAKCHWAGRWPHYAVPPDIVLNASSTDHAW